MYRLFGHGLFCVQYIFSRLAIKCLRKGKKPYEKKLIGFKINLFSSQQRKDSIHDPGTIEPTSDNSHNK
jgi:hypothetical protein